VGKNRDGGKDRNFFHFKNETKMPNNNEYTELPNWLQLAMFVLLVFLAFRMIIG